MFFINVPEPASPTNYASILQPSLIGKGKKFVSDLTGDSCEVYRTLKVALLFAYSVVSEVHGKIFCNLSKRNEDTISDFGQFLIMVFFFQIILNDGLREPTLMTMSKVYENCAN